MPGTTRYSATFDRTYEEEDRADSSPPPNARRSRSLSLQASSALDRGRPYTPLGGRPPTQRSSSTDNGPEHIPTRTVNKTTVKAHSNPFQFVKVGTCPLYKKAEEQLKKTKEIKKPDVLKEEEEEWQSNLDSWKSRRRKMSEDVFRRAEEVRQFELEQEVSQVSQKKTKTFSEMVEQRATRGRALSLCLISSPMELQNWEFEGSRKNGSYSTFSGESEENSTVNSEDEGVSLKGMLEKSENGAHNSHRTNGDSHIDKSDTHNGDYNKLSDLENNLQMKPKEGSYIDSGLESISSHRAGDTPDSGSDFSHDSGSSIDCDSPRTGVNLLEEFSSKSSQISPGHSATNGTTNGFNVSENKSEIKANQSEVPSHKTETPQYEKSIESENEMFVDDYEELQRQSDLLAASKKSETNAQANGNITSTSLKNATPNITMSKISSTPKLKLNLPNGSVEGPVKTNPSCELGIENQKNDDSKVKNKTRRKGVYSMNVSATPNQISQQGNSVNSLFPLSPVTELPSPEDAKTMASTLSSNLTSVSDSKKENVAKEISKNKCIEPTPNTKEIPKPTTTDTETDNSKKVTSEDSKVISSKIEMKAESTVAPVSPSIEKSKEKSVTLSSPLSPVNEKPKLVLRKVKTKPKKVIPPESQVSKDSTSLPPPSPSDVSVKKDDKDKLNKEPKTIVQNEVKKEDNIKIESKQKEPPKIMVNIPANTVAESCDSKSISSINLENDSKEKNKTDSTIIPSTQITENKTTNTLAESPQGEKPKPTLGPKKVKIKIKKVNTSENASATPSKQNKEASISSLTNACSDLSQNSVNISTKETKSTVTSEEKKVAVTNVYKKTEPSTECKVFSTETPAVEGKPTIENKVTSVSSTSNSTESMNTTTKDEVKPRSALKNMKDESKKPCSPSITNSKDTKPPISITPEKAKPSSPVKKTFSTPKEVGNLSLPTKAVCDIAPTQKVKNDQSQNSPSASCDANLSKINEKKIGSVTDEDTAIKKDTPKPSTDSQDENKKSACSKKNKTRTRKKNANSQKVNTPAKQIEECKNLSVDSLNIVFQSEPKHVKSENQTNVKKSEINRSIPANIDLVPDVPPVEQVAEEMEKLILEQLEEEEREKELLSGLQTKSPLGSPEHLLTAPPKLAEPPKEKPPPPPATSEGNQKETSLKRVNSTKRIKKEIYKRRSNFLGIDNADENLACNESSIPPPPALKEILKAEMELDRQGRLKIESEATERLTLEENEIMQKEREIIESLESEERQRQLINGSDDFSNIVPNDSHDIISEEERILLLKNERKRLEAERLMAEEQHLHLIEEKQLREREDFIRKQEADKSAVPLSDTLSVAANLPNTPQPSLPSLSTDTQSRGSLSGVLGDGNSLTSISVPELLKKSSESNDIEKVPQKPAVPPKPLKKKEAIRKERERLRQEQEALQREREEHRRKLIQEQEELLKQKSHAPEAPVASRLGPLPPLVPPPLTTTAPHARDSASFPSRSHHGAPNSTAGSSNSVELMGPAVVRQKVPPPRKVVQNEAWGQQKDSAKGSTKSVPPAKAENLIKPSAETSSSPKPKENNDIVKEDVKNDQKVNDETGNGKQKTGGKKVKRIIKKKMPSVRKQNQDSLTESRYNQNHWLIQEAEMRRITELKERQRPAQLPGSQTCLAEDDVCSNPPRVPVIQPTHNQHLNYHAAQDKMWNYVAQNSVPTKKYPAPAVKEQLHTIYPRETVSQQPPVKPSRVVPMERQEQMLSVSGRKRCSHCNEELGRGAAMIIESLQLYYHINCFQCCVCHAQLGNGSCGADVRVRNQKLHCHNCYSNDEAGLKFSQV